MQFEPATFAEYDEPVPPGGAIPPSPFDPTDAVYAAVRLRYANVALVGPTGPAPSTPTTGSKAVTSNKIRAHEREEREPLPRSSRHLLPFRKLPRRRRTRRR